MRTILIAALAVGVLTGAAHAETRNHTGFDRVRASDQLRVEIAIGPTYSVDVSGGDAHRIATEVEDGALRIRLRDRGWFGGGEPLNAVVRVTMPRLNAIAASRGVSLRAENVQATTFSVASSMGAAVRITGTCQSISAVASMGGVIEASTFECQTADVRASMGGEVRVNAQRTVDASASMGGSVDVVGSPETRETGTAMGGSINIARR